MSAETTYTEAFFTEQSSRSLASARVVLQTLFAFFRPASVIDVGCGVGPWLRAARELGVSEVVGVDGDYVDRDALLIDPSEFLPADLERQRIGDVPRLTNGRRFDLVISVEVAEHLSFARGESFVNDLTALGDVVLFSGAVPFQGGEHHVNEQWPEFWALLFRTCGFDCLDLLRPLVWARADVDWWYAQNLLLFVRRGSVAAERLTPPQHASQPAIPPLTLVHPSNYLAQILKWFHTHRLAAAEEEVADLKALIAAYQSGAATVPKSRAISRAEAAPERPDVFPNTRMERSFPEVLLREQQHRLDAMARDLVQSDAKAEMLSASLRQAYEALQAERARAQAEIETLRRELVETRYTLTQTGAEAERRLSMLQQSRIVRLAQSYHALYSRPVLGLLLRALRRTVRNLRRLPIPLVKYALNDVVHGYFRSPSLNSSSLNYSQPDSIFRQRSIEKILISKLDHIGDFVLGLSAFGMIRNAFPSSEITLLCAPWNEPIAEKIGLFDRVVCLQLFSEVSGENTTVRFDEDAFRSLGLNGFDLAIDFRDGCETRFLLDKVSATFRAGFAAHGVMHHMDLAFPSSSFTLAGAGKVHHSTLQELLASAVVAKHREQEQIHKALMTVAKSGIGTPVQRLDSGPIIGVNVGSGAATKNWPLRHFAVLCSWLIYEKQATVVLFGSNAQIGQSDELAGQLPARNVLNLAGTISLTQFVSTVGSVDLYIGNDTGSTHIAAALDVPTVCLFSEHTSLKSHGPRGAHCICVSALCERNAKSIPIRDVANAVVQLLGSAEGKAPLGPVARHKADKTLIIIDNKTYEEDFRKYLARAAMEDNANVVHIDYLVTLNEELLDIFDGSIDGRLIAETLQCDLGQKPTIVLVGIGLPPELARLVDSLKHLFNDCVVYYDVFDYFRYGSVGRIYRERKRLDLIWRRLSDRVLLLDQGLQCRYPRNSYHLENASHLGRVSGTGSKTCDALVYIGSIDDRVDFGLLETFAQQNIKIDIYGRVHMGDPAIERALKSLLRYNSVTFGGPYDNDDLPKLLLNYSIGFLPYAQNTMTKHINPDKLYHYLNAGLEVVATPIPQAWRMRKYLHIIHGRTPSDIDNVMERARGSRLAHAWPVWKYSWVERWRQLKDDAPLHLGRRDQ
jgi:ADP-heptose:LPS heptosyltransferase/SAM-dependent methyltransferase